MSGRLSGLAESVEQTQMQVILVTDVLDEEGQALAEEVDAQYRHLDVRDEQGWVGLIDEIKYTVRVFEKFSFVGYIYMSYAIPGGDQCRKFHKFVRNFRQIRRVSRNR